jgi:hypothetical protein
MVWFFLVVIILLISFSIQFAYGNKVSSCQPGEENCLEYTMPNGCTDADEFCFSRFYLPYDPENERFITLEGFADSILSQYKVMFADLGQMEKIMGSEELEQILEYSEEMNPIILMEL